MKRIDETMSYSGGFRTHIPFEQWLTRDLSLDRFINEPYFKEWLEYISKSPDFVIEEFMLSIEIQVSSFKTTSSFIGFKRVPVTRSFKATGITHIIIKEYVKRVQYTEEQEKKKIEEEARNKKLFLQALREKYSKEEWYTGIKSQEKKDILLEQRDLIDKVSRKESGTNFIDETALREDFRMLYEEYKMQDEIKERFKTMDNLRAMVKAGSVRYDFNGDFYLDKQTGIYYPSSTINDALNYTKIYSERETFFARNYPKDYDLFGGAAPMTYPDGTPITPTSTGPKAKGVYSASGTAQMLNQSNSNTIEIEKIKKILEDLKKKGKI